MYNTQLTRKYALQAAIDLRDKPETRETGTGLCINLTNAVSRRYVHDHGGTWPGRWGQINDFVDELVHQWPAAHWNTDDTDFQYPVGGRIEYSKEVITKTIWQNPRRIELLNWLITQLEAQSA